MSENIALPPPDPSPEPEPPPPPAPPPARNRQPWLTAAGFVILALALLWVWQNPSLPPPPSPEPVEALARQVAALETRLARLEQRPPPQAPDLGPLTARVTALEQRPAGSAPRPAQPPPDLAPLAARVAALEQRPQPDLAPLEARTATLESGQAVANQLAVRVANLEAVARNTEADLTRRLTAGDQRIAHFAQVQAAALALASGQKLGDVTGAPPALARFAAAAPPTEASLRLAFPQAAHEALAAAHPAAEGKPLLARLWAQTQELVTVRQGEHVLIGDPVAGVLERARAALDAGDLPAAAAAIASLQGPPAQAMASWLAQARALLDARAALASWATAG